MDTPQFGPLDAAKALAAASGYTIVYDDDYKSAHPLNLTGAVSLTTWLGRTGKNGGEYEYAFDGSYIHARPALPPNHGLNLQAKGPAETLELLRKIVEIRKGIGPEGRFLLA